MKKLILGSMILGASTFAIADDNTGPGCGWGSMLFKGQSGVAAHVVAATTNGTSGNNTFGMTTGTNGCDTSKTIHYAGASSVVYHNMDRLSNEIARGEGEILDTLASIMGIDDEDRAAFKRTLQENFNRIYPSADTTSNQVIEAIVRLMTEDKQLAKYV